MFQSTRARQLAEIVFGTSMSFAVVLLVFALCVRNATLDTIIFGIVSGTDSNASREEQRFVNNYVRTYLWHGIELPTTVFSTREIRHMWDVKGLLRAEEASALVALAITLISGFFLRHSGRKLFSSLRIASSTSLVVLILAGIYLYFFFDGAFLGFHEISFANDLWLLDPATAALVRVYTYDFFRLFMLSYGSFVMVIFAILWFVSKRRY